MQKDPRRAELSAMTKEELATLMANGDLLPEYQAAGSAPTKAQLIESILAHEHGDGQLQTEAADAETDRPSSEEPTAVVDGDTLGAAEATGGQPAEPGAAEATPETEQATETSVEEGEEMETVDSGHGIQIPIVPTTGRWIESEVEALIALAAHPEVGGPYRAAAIFEQLTSRSQAACMGIWRKLIADGRVQRSVRSGRDSSRPSLRSAARQAVQWLEENGHEGEEVYSSLKAALG